MALSKGLLELVGLVKDESKRQALQGLMEENQAVFQERLEGNLRQADYDRSMNELKAKVAARERELQTWYDTTMPKHTQALEQLEKANRRTTELEAQVKETSEKLAKGGVDVDEATLQAKVDQRLATFKGDYISKAEAAVIVKQEAAALVKEQADAARKEFFEKTLPATNDFLLNMQDIALTHQREFSEPFDRHALFTFMTEKKVDDPKKAYGEMVAERRQTADREKMKTELREEVKKEFAAANGVPGSGVAAAPELGPLQIVLQKKGPAIPEGVEPGSGVLARLAAAEMRTEGKA